jgi:hypothetical protein
MKRLLLLICLLLLAACSSSGGGSAGGGDPARVVEQYIQAKAKADKEALRPLLCSKLESKLDDEAASFQGLSAKVNDLSCRRDGDTSVVRCAGEIVALYGTEENKFPLGAYQVVQEDGVWKWCGEAS